MNSTVVILGRSTNFSLREEAIDDASYSLGFSILVFVMLGIIAYVSYKLNREWCSDDTNPSRTTSSSSSPYPVAGSIVIIPSPVVGGGEGLDEAALVNYPKFRYSQAKRIKGNDPAMASGCSICLADYKDSDVLRALPECGHFFHLNCIDPWLKLHPTCPICRSSRLPAPLAQLVPPPTTQT